MKINPNGTLVLYGGAVKAKGDGKVGGYLVLFGDEKAADLSGEWFTKSTDFDTDFPGKATPYYHHGLDPDVGVEKLSETKAEIGIDDTGVWIDAQLDLRKKYAKAVYKMVEDEQLGWSSGSAAHLVTKAATGEITHWPLGVDASLTPTPCDPRNMASVKSFVRPLKSVSAPTLAQLQGLKTEGFSSGDKRRMLQAALEQKLAAGGFYVYAYVNEDWIYEASFVFTAGERNYEIPYAIDGFSVTLGDAVEVKRVTTFTPIPTSGGTAPEDPALKAANSQRLRAELNRERLKTLRPRLLTTP